MSDRTRGAVRTGTREGTGAPETTAGTLADDERPADAGSTAPAGSAAKAGGGTKSEGATKSGASAAAPAGAAQPTLAGGSVAAGSVAAGAARAGAPVDDATVRVAGGPARAGEGTDASPAASERATQRPAKAAADKVRTAAGRGRGPRRARLQLRHIDTWSALKISLVVSIALFFVWMVAVGVLFGVLNGLGVFDTLNDLFGQLGSVSGDSTGADSGSEVITAGVVFGGAALIGLINIVLMTALCTVGAVVYNLCSDLVGGVEVTLSERD
jgi:hypothetical protein